MTIVAQEEEIKYETINGKSVLKYKPRVELTIKHTETGREYLSEEEAKAALDDLADSIDYDSIETVEGEGCYPERVRIMDERYKKSGRDAKDHPMHGLYTGLAEEYGEISNDNPS